MNRKLLRALAIAATGITASGLALTSLPANAATTQHAVAVHHSSLNEKPLSASRLAAVRDRQQQMIAHHTAAPVAKSTAKVFTVNTTEDSDLANPAGTHCIDLATGKCSLRAAVDAANNLKAPVKIVLGKHTYTLTSATALTVTNPRGTSVVGLGATKTSIKGDGSGVFSVDALSGASSGLLFVTNARVTGGTAATGGGFYLDDSNAGATLVLNGVIVSGNTATSSGSGGGLYASDYDSVYANNTRFTNNVGYYGAGMYLDWADVNFTNVTIAGNHSAAATNGYGAGIYNYYGVLRFKGGSISGNTAGDATDSGAGGALNDQYGNIALTHVHVDGNTANDEGDGGAFYLYEDLIEVNGGTMSHNRANAQYSSGGAIYVDEGSQLDLHGVTMTGNKVGGPVGEGYGGGAIYDYGYYYANQVTIDQGTTITGSNASAIYTYSEYGQVDLSVADATLSGNHNGSNNGFSGYGCGGAICAYLYEYASVNLSMTNTKVVNNSSTGNYGSGAVSVFAEYYGGASVNLRGNRFAGNVAGTNGYGGALLFYDDDEYAPISVRSQSNTFVGNRAGSSTGEGWGGAVATYYYAAFTDKGSTFSKNVALGNGAYGGAVSNESYQSSRFVGTRFIGNRAGSTGGGSGYGGALYTADEAGTAISKVTMSGNRAASYGGGLYGDSSGYSMSIDQSTISGNTAGTHGSAGYGGGVFADDAVLAVQNSTIANNTARSISGSPGQGGGIYHSGSTFGLRYSTVSGNVAKQGGGIYSYAEGGNLMSSIVSRNHASKGGAEQDCQAAGAYTKLHSLGGNVLGQGVCITGLQSSDKVSRNLHLGKLKNNGGPTKTMAISKKSPAVGRANFQVPTTDQRGKGRPGHHADAGAFELPKVKHHH
jgi:CSLREA domain-containing protein